MESDIGVLWLKTGPKGEYMTGIVTIGDTAHQIVVFKNNKQKPNQPDWRIYKSKPKPETTTPVSEESSVPF